jgi:hypothetical protein
MRESAFIPLGLEVSERYCIKGGLPFAAPPLDVIEGGA